MQDDPVADQGVRDAGAGPDVAVAPDRARDSRPPRRRRPSCRGRSAPRGRPRRRARSSTPSSSRAVGCDRPALAGAAMAAFGAAWHRDRRAAAPGRSRDRAPSSAAPPSPAGNALGEGRRDQAGRRPASPRAAARYLRLSRNVRCSGARPRPAGAHPDQAARCRRRPARSSAPIRLRQIAAQRERRRALEKPGMLHAWRTCRCSWPQSRQPTISAPAGDLQTEPQRARPLPALSAPDICSQATLRTWSRHRSGSAALVEVFLGQRLGDSRDAAVRAASSTGCRHRPTRGSTASSSQADVRTLPPRSGTPHDPFERLGTLRRRRTASPRRRTPRRVMPSSSGMNGSGKRTSAVAAQNVLPPSASPVSDVARTDSRDGRSRGWSRHPCRTGRAGGRPRRPSPRCGRR